MSRPWSVITSSLKLCRPLWTSESPSKEPVLHEKFPHGLKFLENVGNEEKLVIFWLPVQFLIFFWRLEIGAPGSGPRTSRSRVWYGCGPLCSTVFVFVFVTGSCLILVQSTVFDCVRLSSLSLSLSLSDMGAVRYVQLWSTVFVPDICRCAQMGPPDVNF